MECPTILECGPGFLVWAFTQPSPFIGHSLQSAIFQDVMHLCAPRKPLLIPSDGISLSLFAPRHIHNLLEHLWHSAVINGHLFLTLFIFLFFFRAKKDLLQGYARREGGLCSKPPNFLMVLIGMSPWLDFKGEDRLRNDEVNFMVRVMGGKGPWVSSDSPKDCCYHLVTKSCLTLLRHHGL